MFFGLVCPEIFPVQEINLLIRKPRHRLEDYLNELLELGKLVSPVGIKISKVKFCFYSLICFWSSSVIEINTFELEIRLKYSEIRYEKRIRIFKTFSGGRRRESLSTLLIHFSFFLYSHLGKKYLYF